MRCPFCGSENDKVTESRSIALGEAVRRRRQCLDCGSRFTSFERIEEKPFMVKKRDGRREIFAREKIEMGIARAFSKRDVDGAVLDSLVNAVEEDAMLEGKYSREIPAEKIGEIVLEKIAKLDEVAYIRFASVYRHFNSLDEFIREIKNTRSGKK